VVMESGIKWKVRNADSKFRDPLPQSNPSGKSDLTKNSTRRRKGAKNTEIFLLGY
jgi:hypothetical protein